MTYLHGPQRQWYLVYDHWLVSIGDQLGRTLDIGPSIACVGIRTHLDNRNIESVGHRGGTADDPRSLDIRPVDDRADTPDYPRNLDIEPVLDRAGT